MAGRKSEQPAPAGKPAWQQQAVAMHATKTAQQAAEQPGREEDSQQAQTATRDSGKAVVDRLDDFLAIKFPPRKVLIDKILHGREVVMIFAFRGTGKTRFASYLAACLAGGQRCLKWDIPEARRVLYVDGELDGEEVQQRMPAALQSAEVDAEKTSQNLFILNRHRQAHECIPKLNTPAGRAWIVDAIRENGIEAVVLDSLVTLFPAQSGKDWETKAAAINDTLNAIRDTGAGVILLHHAGKGGEQHGSVHNETYVGLSLKMSEIADTVPIDGCRFALTFEKKRNLMGHDVDGLDVKLENNQWTWKPLEAERKEKIISMFAELGMTQTEIARELGINQSNIARTLKNAGYSCHDKGKGKKLFSHNNNNE